MSRTLILGFGHRKYSGKDTAAKIAQMLLWNKGFTPTILAFAGPLKDVIGRDVFQLSVDQLYGNQKEVLDPRWNMSPREILQKAGTEAIRGTFGEDFWAKVAEARMEKLLQDEPAKPRCFVFSDVRFPEEAEMIHRHGGWVVRLDRNGHIPSDDHHVSETALSGYQEWDRVIVNRGTLMELQVEVDEICQQLIEECRLTL